MNRGAVIEIDTENLQVGSYVCGRQELIIRRFAIPLGEAVPMQTRSFSQNACLGRQWCCQFGLELFCMCDEFLAFPTQTSCIRPGGCVGCGVHVEFGSTDGVFQRFLACRTGKQTLRILFLGLITSDHLRKRRLGPTWALLSIVTLLYHCVLPRLLASPSEVP